MYVVSVLVDTVLFFNILCLCTTQVTIQGEWAQWNNKVPKIEVETHKVGSPDIVVPTLDTVRHESLLYTWLAEHKPMVLCGPPGSGKTMTLFSALRALPDFEVWCVPNQYMYMYVNVVIICLIHSIILFP